MSIVLFKFTESFVKGRLPATVFSDAYIELWKIECDTGIILQDDDALSACLSTIFCLSDMYYPEPNKEYGELNEKELLHAVKKEIAKFERKQSLAKNN